MLLPRLTNCSDCTSISALLNDIDCKLKEMASSLYNNTIYLLNQPVSAITMYDLLNYKRILTYKACNPDYASCFTVQQIASRVKLLKFK